ncbi:MAG TPA: hypothetical protein VFJ58_03745 [Armatimonadota bacterium]|nr:hypothetical protein [Armatimonadota bacterium]
MLDTVLEIGRVLRASPDGLKHHRYVKKAPIPDAKRNPVHFWRVPVKSDGSFDFAEREPLIDEVLQKRLFYLNYKSSDADSSKPYIFGDLYRTVNKGVEDGNFRFGDPTKKSWSSLNSFQRAEALDIIPTDRARRFRDAMREQIEVIEDFLRAQPNAYLHFDFGGRGWHELSEEMNLLDESVLKAFFNPTERGYILTAFLYKALLPGTSRSPGFEEGSSHKTRVFHDRGQALDLLYGINYASRASVRKNDVKIVVLPRGRDLTATVIERFFERIAGAQPDEAAEIAEEQIAEEIAAAGPYPGSAPSQSAEDEDELFSILAPTDPEVREIAQFDFVFSKAGGTKADIDMVELAGLDRSKLSYIARRIRGKRAEIEQARSERLAQLGWTKPPFPLTITSCFLDILGDTTRGKKKYQNHLLRVLPQIYTGCYFDDPVLLPALIEKTEFGIRNDSFRFVLLRFAYYFLLKIQDYEGDRLMDIQNSPSYQIGCLLGTMAKPFSGPKSKIRSFEKNYVGLLSRRITTISDVVKLANDINQKLVMHEQLYPSVRNAANALADAVKRFDGRYDKSQCAFGFFESYFAPIPPRQTDTEGAGQSGETAAAADVEDLPGL